MTHRLSKSRLLSGLQCPKKLYLEVRQPSLADYDLAASQRMQMGDRVGELARQLNPGVFLDGGYPLRQALAETERLLAQPEDIVIHEATFSARGLLVRGDSFIRNATGCRLYEVKSSTRVKDYQLIDCAIQSWVMDQAGYPLDEVFIRHINNRFVYVTPGDYTGLFTDVPVGPEIASFKAQVPDWLAQCQTVLAGTEPDTKPGNHCRKPFPCPFQSHCCVDRQTDYPVTTLPRAKKLVSELTEEGIFDIRDIPEERLTKPLARRIREAVVSGGPYISPDLSALVGDLDYPRYYIDFETVNPAIPLWIGTRPYEQIPFQWSCHIEYEHGALDHREFLDVSGQSPMLAFTESLLEAVGNVGTVLVYNASFERRILRDMATRFPEHAGRIDSIIKRLVDLLDIAREHYYHPAMHGSWSIKTVLPTVAPGLDYSKLTGVHNGGEAQNAYLTCISSDVAEEEWKRLAESLKRYCELDTYAMVEMARFFSRNSGAQAIKDTERLIPI
jgi:hypothetical protein